MVGVDKALEYEMNDFDPRKRAASLQTALATTERERGAFPDPARKVNMHCHTFYSFNGYGYSPTYVAWRARQEGLLAAGIVDFDVLDGLEEFSEAGRLLGLRTCGGLETRVFLPQFADKVVNSPGEPGIVYYMGMAFPGGQLSGGMLADLRETAQRRNLRVIERVNAYLSPVELDYDNDVLPLTPNGNATERHICMAYEKKAQAALAESELAPFWSSKLGVPAEAVEKAMQESPAMQALIRSKTMKAGGVGYIKPEGPDFPTLEEVASFTLDNGGIPTMTWLDGTSDGEQEMEQLLDLVMEQGSAALNIIPDRNWNIKDAETKRTKVANLHAVIELAKERNLPIVVGTEMNAHGQRFVDDFDAPEMAPLVEEAIRGARIMYGHSLLQRQSGQGYLSDWAGRHFDSVSQKNDFFAEAGRKATPGEKLDLGAVPGDMGPDAILAALE